MASGAFATEFGCQDSETQEIGFQRYRVTGCGLSATYDCRADTCVFDSPSDSASTTNTPRPVSSTPRPAQERLSTARDAKNPLTLELQLPGALLRFSTDSGRDPAAIRLKLSYATGVNEEQAHSCELEWMLNGEHIEGPKAKFTRDARLTAHSLALPAEFVNTLATVRKVGIKSCDRHWTLLPRQVAEVQGFIELASDEAAWGKASHRGAPGKLVAPSAGWPAWAASGAAPAPNKQQHALEGPALFKLLAPSVFQVEALAAGRSAQGSAVAVSASEVLTNCHVVEAARKIVLKRDGKEWVASLSRADPNTDRCVLNVADANFKPVDGVRSFSSLEVGETVYTLGSPSGFDLSLASGVLSGRREEAGRSFVQTTAPISPGSSGGGLFDAKGNLIGITTLVVVGRERINQSLNFAIPAESFWQP